MLGGLIGQGVSGLAGIGFGIADLIKAGKIKPKYNPYQTSEYAKSMLGGAQQQMNARNPYAAQAQRGILGSQANAMASVQRNATDPAQAMAMAAGLQGQTDASMANQAMQEYQLQQQKIANLMNAQQAMIGEDRMKYQDMMNKYQLDTDMKTALNNSGRQSIVNAIGGMANTAMGAANMQSQDAMQSKLFDMLKNQNNSQASSIAPFMLMQKAFTPIAPYDFNSGWTNRNNVFQYKQMGLKK